MVVLPLPAEPHVPAATLTTGAPDRGDATRRMHLEFCAVMYTAPAASTTMPREEKVKFIVGVTSVPLSTTVAAPGAPSDEFAPGSANASSRPLLLSATYSTRAAPSTASALGLFSCGAPLASVPLPAVPLPANVATLPFG